MEHWTQERYDAFRRELYAQQEEAYRQFHTKLLRSDLPVIGLRAPLLRKIAAEIAKEDGAGFLRICGRETYEERLLYGLVAAGTACFLCGISALLRHLYGNDCRKLGAL